MTTTYSALWLGSAGTPLSSYTPEVGPTPYDVANTELDGSGGVRSVGGVFGTSTLTSAAQADGTITGSFVMPSDPGQAFVSFRASGPFNTDNYYFAVKFFSGVPLLELGKSSTGPLATGGFGLVSDTPHTYILTIEGSTTAVCNLYLDGATTPSLTFSDSTSPWTSGVLKVAAEYEADAIFGPLSMTDTVDAPSPSVPLTGQAVSLGQGTVGVTVVAGLATPPFLPTGAVDGAPLGMYPIDGGGADAVAPLTGQSATVAQGTLTPSTGGVGNADVALTGQSATVSQGTPAPRADAAAALTGQPITVAQGTPVPRADAAPALTGQPITVAQGTPGVRGDQPVALTGQSVPVAQGTPVVALGAPLTGQSATVAQGTLAVRVDASVGLTGQPVAVAQGTPVTRADAAPALTGQPLTVGQGTLAVRIDQPVPLTGQPITVAQGTPVPRADAAPALTGQPITMGQGTIVPSLLGNADPALSGQPIPVAQGTLAPRVDVAPALTGQPVPIGQGSIAPAAASGPELTGQPLTVGQGTLGVRIDVTVALTGQVVTAAQGTPVPVSAMAAALVGQAVAVAQGTLGIQIDSAVLLTGQPLAIGQGTLLVIAGNGAVYRDLYAHLASRDRYESAILSAGRYAAQISSSLSTESAVRSGPRYRSAPTSPDTLRRLTREDLAP